MIRLQPGTPLADAVSRALSAQDTTAADAAYHDAVELAGGARAMALARDHVACLVRWRAYTPALERCDEYLVAFQGDRLLLLTRAEIHCALTHYRSAARDADAVGSMHPVEHQARLHRVRGLVAADRGDDDTALGELREARALFESAGHTVGAAVVDSDLEMIGVQLGHPGTAEKPQPSAPPQTLAELLRRAWLLRHQRRYEAALRLLEGAEDAEGVDPGLLPVLRDEVAELRRLIREDVGGVGMRADPDSPRFDRRLHSAHLVAVACRLLAGRQRPAEAAAWAEHCETVLLDLWPLAKTQADQATWHLVRGELELSRSDLLGHARTQGVKAGSKEAGTIDPDAAMRQASGHFGRAAQLADTAATAEVRLLALRLLGRVRMQLGAEQEAAEPLGAAHRIEEDIAARQLSDDVKVRMLAAASDEHDERVTFAADQIKRHGGDAISAVAVAIESARGQMIVDAIEGRRAELPLLSDIAGAKRWVGEMARDLPRSQTVWLMHATSDRIHHVLLGRSELHHYATRPRQSFRRDLVSAVGDLELLWDNPNYLKRSIESGEFDDTLATIGKLLDIGSILEKFSGRVAVVAHGVLSHVPVAALPVPETADRLVHRFALSDLPSLSIRRLLAHRAVHRRGERSLLVRPDRNLAPAADLPGRATVLEDDQACADRMRDAVAGHGIVRVDSHGRFTEEDAWLELTPAPDGSNRRLRPQDLRSMDLSGCGTVMLGACESGMARKLGRDEPVGFVRSALLGGAAAVVGARWIARDEVAADLLNHFEWYLRYLPRDVALQRAQLDVCAGHTRHTGACEQIDLSKRVESPEHPAHWACWTLYGDAGWQNGLVHRWLARREHANVDPWRHDADATCVPVLRGR